MLFKRIQYIFGEAPKDKDKWSFINFPLLPYWSHLTEFDSFQGWLEAIPICPELTSCWVLSSLKSYASLMTSVLPMSYGSEKAWIKTWVMGYSLVHLLVRSHRSFICLLRTTCFACALGCAHSFARLLTHSLLSLYEMNASISHSFNP